MLHTSKHKPMKLHHLLIVAGTLFALPACERKPTTTEEKVKGRIDDALDRRPHERLRDAAEDARDAAKDVGKDLKGAAKDVKEGTKEVGRDMKEAVKDEKK